ncbi:MAG: hypothetical protein HYT65_01645 [Candidatus Yanofskybacteria bacterium]|nr:hypothetical protein [Candidatus Yanofskybacteria bacterium]
MYLKGGRNMATEKKFVIPPAMLPETGMREVAGNDGKTYLVRNDAMFTGMQHAQGEFSEFFLALRDECRIFGHRCPGCNHIIVPPFEKLCPPCNFNKMTKEYVLDIGITVATPVIVVFAPARFKDEVPFALGYVYLATADNSFTDSALFLRMRTTQGAIRPGIFGKETPVKIVFRDVRRGEILDIFAVPQSELTAAQIAKTPLLESDLEWNRVETPHWTVTPERADALKKVVRSFQLLGERIATSPRAIKDLANWERNVEVRTGGGTFWFRIQDGTLEVHDGPHSGTANLVLTIEDPMPLLRWVENTLNTSGESLTSPPLTDFVIEGRLLLNKTELETVTRLDRITRSLRRDANAG